MADTLAEVRRLLLGSPEHREAAEDVVAYLTMRSAREKNNDVLALEVPGQAKPVPRSWYPVDDRMPGHTDGDLILPGEPGQVRLSVFGHPGNKGIYELLPAHSGFAALVRAPSSPQQSDCGRVTQFRSAHDGGHELTLHSVEGVPSCRLFASTVGIVPRPAIWGASHRSRVSAIRGYRSSWRQHSAGKAD
ncbi:MAG: hypothetical protein ACYDEY_05225 [Acidimicrobiales bacterium]